MWDVPRMLRALSGRAPEVESLRQQLGVAEGRLRAVFESSVIGVIVGDLDGAIREANDAFLWMVGCSREDLEAGRLNWIELTPPEHRSLDASAIGRLQRRRAYSPFEKEYLRRDGSRIPVLIIGMALLGDAGDQCIALALPLIERRASAEVLRASEARLTGIIGSVTDAIITIDAERRIVVFNAAAERMLRCSAAEALGQKIDRFVPERFQAGHAEQIRFTEGGDRLRSGGTSGTLVWRRSDGEEFSIEVSITPAEAVGQTLHTIVLHDVTERQRTEEERAHLLEREQAARTEAEEANRAKDEFLATLSHELRTPLSTMLIWAELLRRRALDESTTARALETLDRNTRVMTRLIDDLLDVSRIVTGKLRLDTGPVDLASVIRAALEAVRPAAEAKRLGVECVLDSGVGPVSGDAARLQQVVWNLLSNAIKFTPKGGRVTVRLETEESSARITVADTGKGITEGFLPHIFEPFRQADSTTTRVHGGLGIGLGIVRQLVEMHGGTVRAESPGEDRGATFTVDLPLAAIREAVQRSEAEPRPIADATLDSVPTLAGVRVLVVDDQAGARDAVSAVLEQCGARVAVAASSVEALEALATFRPDVLVSDVGMPGEDGYALIRRVRALASEDGGRIPAAALTAYARVEDRRRALLAGYQAHVPKPVAPAALVAVIARLAGEGRQR